MNLENNICLCDYLHPWCVHGYSHGCEEVWVINNDFLWSTGVPKHQRPISSYKQRLFSGMISWLITGVYIGV